MSGRGILAGWNCVSAGRQAHGDPFVAEAAAPSLRGV
jgi:hypothetical protein